MYKNYILILDFGGQYSQLIGRRLREANIYCEIMPFDYPLKKIKENAPKGIILSGGPASVYAEQAPKCDESIFSLGIPVMGICYGAQLIVQSAGGQVIKAKEKEFGKATLSIHNESDIFENINTSITCWMSHTDYIHEIPDSFITLASTDSCPVAAMRHKQKAIFALQFHPEVVHTEKGKEIIQNFALNVCKLIPDWDMGDFTKEAIQKIKETVGESKVICGLSGGVDSSVAAVLVHKAIGDHLICIFVDHGLLRKNEGDEVEALFKDQFHMNFIRVNAKGRFLEKLKNVRDPEKKRKIIGEEFIRVFEDEKKKLGAINFLVQGTIYPDIIESGTDKASVIKSHHNVGGLPEDIDFKILEPLNHLFKDEVRKVGKELGIPDSLVNRQPFPGPGLAIRILGEVTEKKLAILREADWIFREEIKKEGLEDKIWQYFAALPDIRSVGVMGDSRTYAHTIALRAVTSIDGMTSDWARIPAEVLAKISNKIVNNVEHVNRVVYDITSKPPATIEWE